MRPVSHSGELPITKPPENLTFSDVISDSDDVHGQQEGNSVDCDPKFEASYSSREPHLLIRGDLNDLVSDLNLRKKRQAELLGSRLKWWHLPHQDTEICFFRNGQIEFKGFFSQENDVVFCNDVCCVIEALEHQHDPTEWRLCN
jgi:hypothetical protein